MISLPFVGGICVWEINRAAKVLIKRAEKSFWFSRIYEVRDNNRIKSLSVVNNRVVISISFICLNRKMRRIKGQARRNINYGKIALSLRSLRINEKVFFLNIYNNKRKRRFCIKKWSTIFKLPKKFCWK